MSSIAEVKYDPQLAMLLATSQPVLMRVHPTLGIRVQQLIKQLYVDHGLSFGAHMGYRSEAHQYALWKQGRAPLELVNKLRVQAGLQTIPASDNKIVTSLKFGLHNLGLAVDIVEDGDPSRAGIQWSWKNNASYLKIGKIAKEIGLEWGGFWQSFKDVPHVQITGGYSVSELISIYRSAGGNNLLPVWQKVNERLAK